MEISILDSIRDSSTPLTAAEICKKTGLKTSSCVNYLKRFRGHIDEARPYTKGYKYSTKKHDRSHQEIFIYGWYG